MSEKLGVKETKEMLVAVNELAVFLVGQFKDGVQMADFSALFSQITENADFKAKLLAAYEDFKKIPAEIKDLDASEGVELASLQLSYVPKFIDVLKK